MASYLIEASFLDSAYELPKGTARKVWKTLSLLSKNPRHPGVHLENLHGKAEGLQSARVDDQYRIILRPDETLPTLLYIGPHDKAYQFAERLPVSVPLPPGGAYKLDIGYAPVPASVSDSAIKGLLLRTIKYLPLASFLIGRPASLDSVQLGFSQIEDLIRAPLPPAARRYRAWWANETGRTRHVQAHAWMAVGWKVRSADLNRGTVTFARSKKEGQVESHRSHLRSSEEV